MRSSKKVNILFLAVIALFITVSLGYIPIPGFVKTTEMTLVFSEMMVFVPAIIYLIAAREPLAEMLPFHKMKLSTVFMVVLFAWLLLPLITVINAFSMLFVENTMTEFATEMLKGSFPVNLFLMAVLPAFCEEFVFRGVLFQSYRRSHVIQGVFLSGIAFGLMHLNFNQFSYALVLGIIFALLVEVTGSIWASMIAHFVINANSVVLMTVASKMTSFMDASGNFFSNYGFNFDSTMGMNQEITPETLLLALAVYGGIAVITTALAACVFVWIAKHCNRLEHMRQVLKVKPVFAKGMNAINWIYVLTVLLSIGFMIYIEVAL